MFRISYLNLWRWLNEMLLYYFVTIISVCCFFMVCLCILLVFHGLCAFSNCWCSCCLVRSVGVYVVLCDLLVFMLSCAICWCSCCLVRSVSVHVVLCDLLVCLNTLLLMLNGVVLWYDGVPLNVKGTGWDFTCSSSLYRSQSLMLLYSPDLVNISNMVEFFSYIRAGNWT